MEDSIIRYGIMIMILLFARAPFAVWFLNREDGTDKGFFDYNRAEQFLLVVMWYSATKEENKMMARILNAVLLFCFSVFIGSIIFLYATGAMNETY